MNFGVNKKFLNRSFSFHYDLPITEFNDESRGRETMRESILKSPKVQFKDTFKKWHGFPGPA